MPEDLQIACPDGTLLAATLFSPPHKTSRAAVVAPGMAMPARFYARYAAFLAESGIATVTFTYRGMKDVPLSASPHRMRDWGEQDIPAVIDWVSTSLQPEKFLYVGHSAGGQLLGLAPNNTRVDAAFFVSCQSGYWVNYPNRWWYWLVWNVIFPGLVAACGYFPARRVRFGEDIPPGVALEWARWCRTPGYLYGDPTLDSRKYVENFQRPLLAWYFSDDPWATPGTRAEMLAPYAAADVTERVVRPDESGARHVGHMGFFRDSHAETLWRESLDWLKQW
ncbi:MAG: hypothetical protein FJX76_19335 [Armatimonadetes bacterium]|nr:hypothetical protein [Armatimonadota bacterium]